MNFLRHTRHWTWAVMAWMAMSLLAANVAPLMNTGVPMEVCSVTPGGARVAADANSGNSRVGHNTWQCAQCLPFVATASAWPQWRPAAMPMAVPSVIIFQSWLALASLPYGARAPPLLS